MYKKRNRSTCLERVWRTRDKIDFYIVGRKIPVYLKSHDQPESFSREAIVRWTREQDAG